MKKSLKFVFILTIVLMFSNYVFAGTQVSKNDATMKLVEDNVCEMSFGKYGHFTKKMKSIDTDNKTIDITLTATNDDDGKHTHTEDQTTTTTTTKDIAGEVVLLIDASNSMSSNSITVNGSTTTRKQLVLNAANDLVDKLFTANPQIKIGVVEFATSNVESEKGTDKDAKTITNLVNDKTAVKNALTTVSTDTMGAQTDIEVGLDTAQSLLNESTSSDTKKYIIMLTDAIPNTAKGITYDFYTTASATPTKNKLLEIANNNINIISMLINMSDEEIAISQESPKPTYKEYAQRVFGTQLNPTAGTVYYVEDEGVTDTVTNTIYTELIPQTETTEETTQIVVDDSEQYALTDIVIKDYFPEDIINNFNFAYLTKPEKGNVTAEVNKDDNSITWTISELKAGESATFTYRLSLKDTFDKDIVGKNLPTNKDVTIDYKEGGKDGEQVHNDKCPIVALDIQAKTIIPQTGSNVWAVVGTLVSLSLIIGATSFIIYKKHA